MIGRTDDDGRWESHDDGRTWLLVEPSQEWLDARANDPEPEPDPIEALQAQLAERQATIDALLAALGGDDD